MNKHLYKPFVPNDQVTKAYNLIINHKPKFVEQTTATNIKLFADYVKDTWIVDESKTKQSNVFKQILNQFNRTGSARTNNDSEGSNHGFANYNSKSSNSNPNIYTIIQSIRDYEIKMSVEFYNNESNNSHRRVRRKQDIERDIKIARLKNDLSSNTIDLFTYIQTMSHLFDFDKKKKEETNDDNKENESDKPLVPPPKLILHNNLIELFN